MTMMIMVTTVTIIYPHRELMAKGPSIVVFSPESGMESPTIAKGCIKVLRCGPILPKYPELYNMSVLCNTVSKVCLVHRCCVCPGLCGSLVHIQLRLVFSAQKSQRDPLMLNPYTLEGTQWTLRGSHGDPRGSAESSCTRNSGGFELRTTVNSRSSRG